MALSPAEGNPAGIRHVHPDEESSPGVLLWGGGVVAALIVMVAQVGVGFLVKDPLNWILQSSVIAVFIIPIAGAPLAWGIDRITKFRDRATAAVIFGVIGTVLGGLWGLVLSDFFLSMMELELNSGTMHLAFWTALFLAVMLGLALGLGRYFADFMGQHLILAASIGGVLFLLAMAGALRTLSTTF